MQPHTRKSKRERKGILVEIAIFVVEFGQARLLPPPLANGPGICGSHTHSLRRRPRPERSTATRIQPQARTRRQGSLLPPAFPLILQGYCVARTRKRVRAESPPTISSHGPSRIDCSEKHNNTATSDVYLLPEFNWDESSSPHPPASKCRQRCARWSRG